MSKGLKFGCIGVVIVLVLVLIIGYSTFKNTYNKMVTLDESVNNAWAQVENVLQRRMDLIPNLVETVKGYASFERETLEAVIQARANATRTQVNAESLMENPQLMNQYLESQNQLSSALSRLMVVVERYPELKANQNFLRLQDELAGTENRIAVERRRFNDVVREYNQTLRQFPTNIIAGFFGFETRPYFEAPEEAQQAPRVEFN
ncbi:LemA family protein [candidate division KSB1 bacterium]|nr:LemA family protein [candidate division KSB1 bacterium]